MLRRDLLLGSTGAFATVVAGSAAAQKPISISSPIAVLETRSRGRLGVAIVDLHTNRRIEHRADERFPMASTFKVLAAAKALARVDAGEEKLDRVIRYSRADLLPYSPAVEKNLSSGMTVEALCAAAVTLSDNAAANLLMDSYGGPAAITAFARSLGDRVTRLDRREPALNEARPGDVRDTTSPAAMANTLNALANGNGLSAASRRRLVDWMVASKTGETRLRAGLSKTWRVGDKTGTTDNGTTNDIAIAWPPNRKPVLITAYLTGSPLDAAGRNAVLADVGRFAAAFVMDG